MVYFAGRPENRPTLFGKKHTSGFIFQSSDDIRRGGGNRLIGTIWKREKYVQKAYPLRDQKLVRLSIPKSGLF
jgi:hypothetical protein